MNNKIEKLSAKQINEYAAKNGYETYTGGCGPTYDQMKTNAIVLFDLIKMTGIPCKLEHDPVFDDTENYPKSVKVLDIYVGYDRWGFCSSDNELTLDQESLESAYNFCVDTYISNLKGIQS